MPIHEYECPTCGKKVELIVQRGEYIPRCDKCSNFMNRLISSSNFAVSGYNAANGYSSK